MNYQIKDIGLADEGSKKVEWAYREMPVLEILRKKYSVSKPFSGKKIAACLHVTTETANLITTLRDAGAQVYLCASNPLSTSDEVAAYLAKEGIFVFAQRGEDAKSYWDNIKTCIESEPDITIDDGADLTVTLHKEYPKLADKVVGGCEETTTGVHRIEALHKDKLLKFPFIAVNDAMTKHFFDNRYGTGQSTLDGIIRATNALFAGKRVVVAGYGWCGKGVSMRAKGMGARVIVTEVEPVRALEAIMDGFDVMPMYEAAKIGDIFITVTGNCNVIRFEHILSMKDGAIVSNSGHFNVEIDVDKMEEEKVSKRRMRHELDEYTFKNGKKVFLVGEGRLVNLAAAEGHPSSVMDMSFANQFLSALYLLTNKIEIGVYPVPIDIDREIARLKIKSMGTSIDTLSAEQEKYMKSW